jgi:hypothetical protein
VGVRRWLTYAGAGRAGSGTARVGCGCRGTRCAADAVRGAGGGLARPSFGSESAELLHFQVVIGPSLIREIICTMSALVIQPPPDDDRVAGRPLPPERPAPAAHPSNEPLGAFTWPP